MSSDSRRKGRADRHLKERVRRLWTDVPIHKLGDRNGYFFRANMAIDVDGSPRAYYPGNRDPSALDTIDDADNEGSSTTYVQGEVATANSVSDRIQASTFQERRSVSASHGAVITLSMRSKSPFVVFPQDFKDVELGDLAVVVNLVNYKWTHAIFADTNPHVGEASIRTAPEILGAKTSTLVMETMTITTSIYSFDARSFRRSRLRRTGRTTS